MRPLLRGVAAGIVGTAAMTAMQLAAAKVRGEPLGTPVPEKWDEAPAPAQAEAPLVGASSGRAGVARLSVGVAGREQVELLARYQDVSRGEGQAAVREQSGPLMAGGAEAGRRGFAAPWGVYRPPWRYPAKDVALDLGYHLAYGLGVSETYARL